MLKRLVALKLLQSTVSGIFEKCITPFKFILLLLIIKHQLPDSAKEWMEDIFALYISKLKHVTPEKGSIIKKTAKVDMYESAEECEYIKSRLKILNLTKEQQQRCQVDQVFAAKVQRSQTKVVQWWDRHWGPKHNNNLEVRVNDTVKSLTSVTVQKNVKLKPC